MKKKAINTKNDNKALLEVSKRYNQLACCYPDQILDYLNEDDILGMCHISKTDICKYIEKHISKQTIHKGIISMVDELIAQCKSHSIHILADRNRKLMSEKELNELNQSFSSRQKELLKKLNIDIPKEKQ